MINARLRAGRPHRSNRPHRPCCSSRRSATSGVRRRFIAAVIALLGFLAGVILAPVGAFADDALVGDVVAADESLDEVTGALPDELPDEAGYAEDNVVDIPTVGSDDPQVGSLENPTGGALDSASDDLLADAADLADADDVAGADDADNADDAADVAADADDADDAADGYSLADPDAALTYSSANVPAAAPSEIIVNSLVTGATAGGDPDVYTDAYPGDGVCAAQIDGLGQPAYDDDGALVTTNPVCTLTAALMEVNALYALDVPAPNPGPSPVIRMGVTGELNIGALTAGTGTPATTAIPGATAADLQRMYPNWLPPSAWPNTASGGTELGGTELDASDQDVYTEATPITSTGTIGMNADGSDPTASLLGIYNGWFAANRTVGSSATCPAPDDLAPDSEGGLIGSGGAVFVITAPITLDLTGVTITSGGSPGADIDVAIFAILGNGITVENVQNIYGTNTFFYVGPCAQNINLIDLNTAPPNANAEQFLAIRGGATSILLQGTDAPQYPAYGTPQYGAPNAVIPGSSTLQGLSGGNQSNGYVVITGTDSSSLFSQAGNITIDGIYFKSDGGENCGANGSSSCSASILTFNTNADTATPNQQYVGAKLTLSNSVIENLDRTSGGNTKPGGEPRGVDLRAVTIGGTLNCTSQPEVPCGELVVENNYFVTPGYRPFAPVIDFTGTSTSINNFNITGNQFVGMSQGSGSLDTATLSATGGAALMLGGGAAGLVPVGGEGIIANNTFQWTGLAGPNAIYWDGGQTATPISGHLAASFVSIHDNAFSWPVGTSANMPAANAGIRLIGTGFVEMTVNTFTASSASQQSSSTNANLVSEETGNNVALLVDNLGPATGTASPGPATANGELGTWYPYLSSATMGTSSNESVLGMITTNGCLAPLEVMPPTFVSGVRSPVGTPLEMGIDIYWTATDDAEVYLGTQHLQSTDSFPYTILLDLPLPGDELLSQFPNISGATVGPVDENGKVSGYLRVQTQDPNASGTPASSQYSRIVEISGTGCVAQALHASVGPVPDSTGYQGVSITTGYPPFSDGTNGAAGWANEPNDNAGGASVNPEVPGSRPAYTGTLGYTPGEDGKPNNDLIRTGDSLTTVWDVTLSGPISVTPTQLIFTQTVLPTVGNPAVVNSASLPVCTGGAGYITANYASGLSVPIQPMVDPTLPDDSVTSVVLTCPVSTTVDEASLIETDIWVANTSPNGSTFTFSAQVVGGDPDTQVIGGEWVPEFYDPGQFGAATFFTVSAAPRWDIQKWDPVQNGVGVGTLNSVDDVAYVYYRYPVTIATDRRIGVAAPVQPVTVQDIQYALYPAADSVGGAGGGGVGGTGGAGGAAGTVNGTPGTVVAALPWELTSCIPTSSMPSPWVNPLVNPSTGAGQAASGQAPTDPDTVAAAGTCTFTRLDDTDPASAYTLSITGLDYSGGYYPNPGGGAFGVGPYQSGGALASGPYYAASFMVEVRIPASVVDAAVGAAGDGIGALEFSNMLAGFAPVTINPITGAETGNYPVTTNSSGSAQFNNAGNGEPGYCPPVPNSLTGAGSGAGSGAYHWLAMINGSATTGTAIANLCAGGSDSNNIAQASYEIAQGAYRKYVVDRAPDALWEFGEVRLPGMSTRHDGNAMVQPGETHSTKVVLNNLNPINPLTGIGMCDVFDNTMVQLAPLAAQSGGALAELATVPYCAAAGTGNTPTAPCLGSQFVQPLYRNAVLPAVPPAVTDPPAASVPDNALQYDLQQQFSYQFGHIDLSGDDPNLGLVNGVLADPTTSADFDSVNSRWFGNWTNQRAVTCDNQGISWFTEDDLIDSATQTLNIANLNQINVVYVTANSGFALAPTEGIDFNLAFTQRSTFNGGPHAGLAIPSQTIFANFANIKTDTWAPNWNTPTYVPGAGTTTGAGITQPPTGETSDSTTGDRWTVANALASLKTQTLGAAANGGATVDTTGYTVAGNHITWQLLPTITSDALNTGVNNVVITAQLPAYAVMCTETASCLFVDIINTDNFNNTSTYIDANGNTQTLPGVSQIYNTDGSSTLTWTFPYGIMANTIIGACADDPTTNCGIQIMSQALASTPDDSVLVLSANLTVDGIVPISAMQDTHTVIVSATEGVVAVKSVDHHRDPMNDNQLYTLTLRNNTPIQLDAPIFYDVFPFNGDGGLLYSDDIAQDTDLYQPSKYSGTSSLIAPPVVTLPPADIPAPPPLPVGPQECAPQEGFDGMWLSATGADGTWASCLPVGTIPFNNLYSFSTNSIPLYGVLTDNQSIWSIMYVQGSSIPTGSVNNAYSTGVTQEGNGVVSTGVVIQFQPSFLQAVATGAQNGQFLIAIQNTATAPMSYLWGTICYDSGSGCPAAESETDSGSSTGTNSVIVPGGTFCYWTGDPDEMPISPTGDAENDFSPDFPATSDSLCGDPTVPGNYWTETFTSAYVMPSNWDGVTYPVWATGGDTSLGAASGYLITGMKYFSAAGVEMAGNSAIAIGYTLTQFGNKPGDQYTNRFIGYSATLNEQGVYEAIVSPETRVTVVSFAVGDFVWVDADTYEQHSDGIFTPNSADQPVAGLALQLWGVGVDGIPGTADDGHICVNDDGVAQLGYIPWDVGPDGILGTPDDLPGGTTGPDGLPGTADDLAFCGPTDPTAAGYDKGNAQNGGNIVTDENGRWAAVGLGTGPANGHNVGNFYVLIPGTTFATEPWAGGSVGDGGAGSGGAGGSGAGGSVAAGVGAPVNYGLLAGYTPITPTSSETSQCTATNTTLPLPLPISAAQVGVGAQAGTGYVVTDPGAARNENVACNQDGYFRADGALLTGVLHLQPVTAVDARGNTYFVNGGGPTTDAPADGTPGPAGIDDTFTNLTLDIAFRREYPLPLSPMPFTGEWRQLSAYLVVGGIVLALCAIETTRRRPSHHAFHRDRYHAPHRARQQAPHRIGYDVQSVRN